MSKDAKKLAALYVKLMEARGLIKPEPGGMVAITPKGREVAERFNNLVRVLEGRKA